MNIYPDMMAMDFAALQRHGRASFNVSGIPLRGWTLTGKRRSIVDNSRCDGCGVEIVAARRGVHCYAVEISLPRRSPRWVCEPCRSAYTAPLDLALSADERQWRAVPAWLRLAMLCSVSWVLMPDGWFKLTLPPAVSKWFAPLVLMRKSERGWQITVDLHGTTLQVDSGYCATAEVAMWFALRGLDDYFDTVANPAHAKFRTTDPTPMETALRQAGFALIRESDFDREMMFIFAAWVFRWGSPDTVKLGRLLTNCEMENRQDLCAFGQSHACETLTTWGRFCIERDHEVQRRERAYQRREQAVAITGARLADRPVR